MLRNIYSYLTVLILSFFLVFNSYAIYPEPVASKRGMVVTEQHLATDVGLAILKQGGNAIDAAVAIGYALAVVHPSCGNLGGGGFMTLRLADGKETFINFREKAPLAATENMFLDNQGNVIPDSTKTGYKAVGTPGTVMGLEYALKHYGSLSREKILAPAIKLAKDGFILEPFDAMRLKNNQAEFLKQKNMAAIFLKNGQPFEAGDRLIQTELAQSLNLIAKQGSDAFYKGALADKIVAASNANGGILSKEDFLKYTVEELKPIQCDYRGYHIISAPPPSSGGATLCEMLNILEKYPLNYLGYHSAQTIHYLTEAMRFSYFDRNRYLGDPNFVKNPVELLTSKAYAEKINAQIQPYRSIPSQTLGNAIPLFENYDTTHYSVVDAKGNAVSVTYTLNNLFGANVMAEGTGIILNDEMDDFAAKAGATNQFGLVQSSNNTVAPGKRPLSSMTPTIATKDNQLFMLVGSPGGSRIITTVLETLLNVIDYHMDIRAAVDSPRIHHQWMPDILYLEPRAASQDTLEKLSAQGYEFAIQKPWDASESILIDPKTRIMYGANDDRRPAGKAAGF